MTEPDGILAGMVQKDSGVEPLITNGTAGYFIDRNPRFFDFILDYLRDPQNFHKIIPSNKQILRQLHVEANYYRLLPLCEILVEKSQSVVSLWED